PSDLAPMLVALEATITIAGPDGTRTVPLGEFFVTPAISVRRETVLKDGEIVTQLQVPASNLGQRSTYIKFKERDSLDFAIAAVPAAVEFGPDKAVKRARLVLGGVGTIPWQVPAAEQFLAGKKLTEDVNSQAARIALEGAKPMEQNAYKIPLTQTLV